MKPSILLCAVLLAACGAGTDESAETPPQQPAAEKGATMPADTALQGTPMIGAAQEAQKRVDQAEADMAERARQADEQVRAAQGGTSQP